MIRSETKRPFLLLLLSRALTNLGDELSSPKTTLTWVLGAVGAPAQTISMLVPVRESLSMLPQLALGAWVRQHALRKPIWQLGSLLQALAILGCAATALWLRGATAGIVVLGCLIVFALARSLNSIATKDLVGKSVPKGRRGRLTGWGSGISGAISLAVGAWFVFGARGQDGLGFYALLLAAAGSLWLIAMAVMTPLREEEGETAGGENLLRETFGRLDLLRTDRGFRLFVIARALLMGSALSSPYYVMLGRAGEGASASHLGAFLISGGLASTLASPVWGALADRSSCLVMRLGGLLTGLLGFGLFSCVRWAPEAMASDWLFPAFYFGLGIAHAGVRTGRKTYVIDLAGGVKRTDYVTVGNSLIGVLLLALGGLTSALSFLAPEWIVLGLGTLALAGASLTARLPRTAEAPKSD